jgi:branched-chain amino acid transport system ATP-binding protein
MTDIPILEGRNLTKRFGQLAAVNDVSFTVERGEIVGIIGPNGAGKTTLINVISGAERDWSGELYFQGEKLGRRRPHQLGKLGIARTYQVAQPFAGMTVLENVMVGALYGHHRQRRVQPAREQVLELLTDVDLVDRADAPVTELNVPERKRLEIARALSTEPEVLLLDEVMAGLNSAEVDRALALIRQVHARGITILLVEHVMKVIASLSDRIIVLHHGEKIFEGTPQVVFDHPEVIDAYLGARYRRREDRSAAASDPEAEAGPSERQQ